MDQNTENPNEESQSLFEEPPLSKPASAEAESVAGPNEQVPPAAEEVIDVPAASAAEPTPSEAIPPEAVPPPSPNISEPPLQPEIVGGPTQAPPQKSSNGWVIALIVLLVLCCCCVLLIIPLFLLGNVLAAIIGSVYSTIIGILNSIFGGAIRFY